MVSECRQAWICKYFPCLLFSAKKEEIPGHFSVFGDLKKTGKKLSLGELWCTACSFQSILLAFLHSWVTG